MERRTYMITDRQTDMITDRQTDMITDRQTDIITERQDNSAERNVIESLILTLTEILTEKIKTRPRRPMMHP